MTLTRADMRCWLINLPKDTERRANMERQLNALGLEHQLFEGVNGREREEELRQLTDVQAYERNMGQTLLPGKMGCYQSHLGVWRAFLDSGAPVALIFEDDVVFHDDFNQALDTALAACDDWDLIRFCCVRAKLPVRQKTLGPYRMNAYAGPFTGNAAYLIKRDLVARLLPDLLPQTRAFDHELNRFFRHNYRQFGLEPWACHPDDGGTSSITGVQFGSVKKPHWSKRLPHLRLKAANYFRRAAWLLRKGMLFRLG